MIQSEAFGRTFWIDANDNFKSAPSLVSGGADYEARDYVVIGQIGTELM